MQKALFSVALAASTLAVAACGPQAEQTVETAADDTANALADIGDATENAAEDAGDALTPTPDGQAFVDRAAKSDAFEIAAAKLAQSNAASAEVKSFATEMTRAHTDSTAKIKAAAAQATPPITPQPALTEDQNAKLADLGKLTGAEFDRQYMAGQVKAHEDALALMERYSQHGDVAPLKTVAAEIAPIVQRHLEMALELNR